MSCSEHGFSYPGRRRESQASCSWSYVANYCCKLFDIKNEKVILIPYQKLYLVLEEMYFFKHYQTEKF